MNRLWGARQPIINGDGLQTRDYIHVSDVVAANVAALGRPGFHIYNVGTGQETDVVELYRAIATSLDRRSRSRPMVPACPASSADLPSMPPSSDPSSECPTPHPLSDGIARTAEWFKSRA